MPRRPDSRTERARERGTVVQQDSGTDRQTGKQAARQEDIRADRESTWLPVSFLVHVTDETQMQLSLYFKRFMRETTLSWQSQGAEEGGERGQRKTGICRHAVDSGQ